MGKSDSSMRPGKKRHSHFEANNSECNKKKKSRISEIKGEAEW